MMKQCLWLCAVLILGQPLRAQDEVEVHFTANKGSALIGEPIELMLTAVIPKDAIVTSWPKFPADWLPFDVQTVSELTVREDGDGSLEYHQTLSVSLWMPGEYQTPETSIEYQLAGSSEPRTLDVVPVFITVASVLDGRDMTLRPFKSQISLPYVSPVVIAVSIAVLSALAIFAIRRLRLRRSISKREVLQSTEDGLSPAARTTLRELRDIVGRDLSVEYLYPAVADCLRTYTQNQFKIPALDMTTVELLRVLPPRLPLSLQRELQRILEQADLVKFARYQPDEDAAQRYVDIVGKWVRVADKENLESVGVVE